MAAGIRPPDQAAGGISVSPQAASLAEEPLAGMLEETNSDLRYAGADPGADLGPETLDRVTGNAGGYGLLSGRVPTSTHGD